MSVHIENLRKIKRQIELAAAWSNLIGDKYAGGGGGTGALRSVDIKAVVYHQAYDGATNYHDAPEELKSALEQVIKREFPKLLSEALEALEEKRQSLASLALKEHSELLAEVGMEPQS